MPSESRKEKVVLKSKSSERSDKVMERNRLKELSSKKGFISGIYNYCDRWCERCPQTSRCLNYSIAREDPADPALHDIKNEAFWKNLSGIFNDAIELLKERASADGLNLDALEIVKEDEEVRLVREAADSSVISRAAILYRTMAEDCLSNAGPLDEETEMPASPVEFSPGDRTDDELQDTLEVIRWYQNQIYVKVMRAITGAIEEQKDPEEGPDQYAKDSDGSAKVALIGIDRSIAAWEIMHNRYPGPDIKEIITHLVILRNKIENHFPEARSFIRPGFDAIDLKS